MTRGRSSAMSREISWNFAEARARLKNEPAQVGVPREVADVFLDERRIDFDPLAGPVGRGEAHLGEDAFEHRPQTPRTDIFDRGIDLHRDPRHRVDRIRRKRKLDSFGAKKSFVLLDEACLCFGEDTADIVPVPARQLGT